MSTDNNYTKVFDWALVELMGHQRIVGAVSEQQIGGETFIRVDVPEIEDDEVDITGFTKLYGKGAIYAITPLGEATARAAIRALAPVPVQPYELRLPSPQIESQYEEYSDDDEEDVPF